MWTASDPRLVVTAAAVAIVSVVGLVLVLLASLVV